MGDAGSEDTLLKVVDDLRQLEKEAKTSAVKASKAVPASTALHCANPSRCATAGR